MNITQIHEILESLRQPEPHQLDLEDGIWTDGYHQALADVNQALEDAVLGEVIDNLLIGSDGLCNILGDK